MYRIPSLSALLDHFERAQQTAIPGGAKKVMDLITVYGDRDYSVVEIL
jgi:hypothetical protein